MIQITAERLVERVRRLLGGMPPHLQAAALPWRHKGGGIEILLVTSRDSGRWIPPRGRPEPGEPLHRAAEREAFEEAGIRGHVSQEAIGSYMLGGGRRAARSVEVFVFPLEVITLSDEWPEMRERERRWLTPARAAKRIDEPGLAQMVRSFHRIRA